MKPWFLSPLALFVLCAAPAWTQITLNSLPTRTVGHPVTPLLEQNTLYSSAPNLVEGRELYSPRGVAVDTSVTPSPIYVADTFNSRVLGWKDASAFASGQMADIVIGQNDFFTTWPEGPNTSPYSPGLGLPLQSGLSYPTGLAALNGDLYVVDTSNNRVLRYPKPFANPGQPQLPDLVLGQPSFTSTTANYTGKVSAKGVSFGSNSAALAFDASGNLWITDPGNSRVLEFAQADLANGGAGIAATVVLGQPDMVTTQSSTTTVTVTSLTQFAVPDGIAVDSLGRIYVTDSDGSSINRVLAFVPTNGAFTNGQAAANMLGYSTGQTAAQMAATQLKNPTGVFCLPGNAGVGVVDSGNNRILIFQHYELWPVASLSTSTSSAQAAVVVGQNGDFTSTGINNTPTDSTYTLPPTASVFSGPSAAAMAGGQLFVADAGNNRVLAMPIAGTTVSAATRVLGQDRLDTGSINLIEGREFQFISSSAFDAGIAIDSTGPVQHVYVADTYNNRVLAFSDLRKLSAGVKADLVIGQANGQTALCNYPTGNPNTPTAQSLCSPTGLVVDSAGNLWVADRGNGRVLRFPAPFSQTGQPQADLVLGQASFTATKVSDPTAITMSAPYGVAISQVSATDHSVKVAVSDQALSRVLVFQSAANGVFTSGQAAFIVIGQSDFRGSASGSGAASLYYPHHIALDSSDRLYVADTANNRINIYDSLDNSYFPFSGASAVLSLTKVTSSSNLYYPFGIYVNPSTSEIWVADTYNRRFVRYPQYLSLLTNQTSATTVGAVSYVLAIAQDAYGAVLTADATNRVALYFPGLTVQNLATDLTTRPVAPGMMASVVPVNSTIPFGNTGPIVATSYPLPTDLHDLQVLFGGVSSTPPAPVPLFSLVYTQQIDFLVPMNAPTSGLANIQVVSKSTGQVYGAATVAMNAVSPALFKNPNLPCTSFQQKDGQTGQACTAAVINFDNGQPNGPANPAKHGSWIEIYGTGQGFVSNAPADGDAPTGLTPTPSLPLVYLNAISVDDPQNQESWEHVNYSGLAPGYAGLWQINVQIPQNVSPGSFTGGNYTSNQVDLEVLLNGWGTYDSTQKPIHTIIYVQ